VVVEGVMRLAAGAAMPQVRAVASLELGRRASDLEHLPAGDDAATAAATLLARDIRRFLERPYSPQIEPAAPDVPPGAPIGEPDEQP
jgi:hypothetical protein